MNVKKLPPQVEQASAEYKAVRDQILALKAFSGFQLILDYFIRERDRAMNEFKTCSLETDTDKKNLFTVRGEYNISEGFLTYIKNLELSKEREEKK